MSLKRVRRYSTISFSALVLALITPVSAHAITTGNCNVTVNSATGVVLVNNGGYCYLAFSATGSNSFTVPSGVTSAAVLVVAGGGAGGSGAWGGGGGAGGVLYGSSYPLTSGAMMNLSVGAGGLTGSATTVDTTNRSNNGDDSWINSSSTFVAKGGGAGASFAYYGSSANASGSSGGSGGGATEFASGGSGGSSTQTLPTYATTAYGNIGGSTPAANNTSGAGGGGAGAQGTSNTLSGVGGAGGAGTNAFSSWFTAIGQYGVGGYIAGGGGGGTATTRGSGGSGGGGIGADQTNTTAGNGVVNTGGGGGGASYNGGALPGGNGGSGLIIFKFAEILSPAVIGTPTLSGTPYKGISVNIAVTIDSAGTVRFFVDNKRIANCLRVGMTGTSPSFTATCSWKPPTQGFHSIKATVTPTNAGQAAQTSATRQVFVFKRTTTR